MSLIQFQKNSNLRFLRDKVLYDYDKLINIRQALYQLRYIIC